MVALSSCQIRPFQRPATIALVVSEANGCRYRLAAHSHAASYLSKTSLAEIAPNRQASSSEAKTAAVAQFAAKVVEARGHVSDAELAAVRAAGMSRTPPEVPVRAVGTGSRLANSGWRRILCCNSEGCFLPSRIDAPASQWWANPLKKWRRPDYWMLPLRGCRRQRGGC
jgi:AhpD family alkylhydroperoxidase